MTGDDFKTIEAQDLDMDAVNTLTSMVTARAPFRSLTGDSANSGGSGYFSPYRSKEAFTSYARSARTSLPSVTAPGVMVQIAKPGHSVKKICCMYSLNRCLEYNRALDFKYYELADSIYQEETGPDFHLGWEVFECDIELRFSQGHIQNFEGIKGESASTFLTAFRHRLQLMHEDCCQMKSIMQRPDFRKVQPARIALEEAYTGVAKAGIAQFRKRTSSKSPDGESSGAGV